MIPGSTKLFLKSLSIVERIEVICLFVSSKLMDDDVAAIYITI